MQPHLVSSEPRVLASIVSPDHVRGNGQVLEILDVEASVITSRRQLVERLTPHPTFKRTACTLFPIRNGHRLDDTPRYGFRRSAAATDMAGAAHSPLSETTAKKGAHGGNMVSPVPE